MSDTFKGALIGIVTPTYNRSGLLRRFIRRLRKQSYRNWIAVIVHDGPSEEFQRLAANYSNDPRLHFFSTERRANDCGNTPRFAGANYLSKQLHVPDYAVFWDDDNYFYSEALEDIARLATELESPDFFMVGMEYRRRVLPPPDLSFEVLEPGEVDTANFVVRPVLAANAYGEVVNRNQTEGIKLLISDYLTFEVLRAEQDTVSVCPHVVVGFHDGLRAKPFIRHLLGIGPLDLASRPWVQRLTMGKYRQRSAGGLD